MSDLTGVYLQIAGVAKESIVDGPGIRYTIFTQGCYHNCPGCHNPESHKLDGGYKMSIDEILKEIDENPILDGVTISGGEPMLQKESLYFLLKEIKKRKLSIYLYTGYTMEELVPKNLKLLKEIDFLIDGKFIEKLKSLELKFRGSSNQRIINIEGYMANYQ